MPTNRLTSRSVDDLVSVSPIDSPVLVWTPGSLAVNSTSPAQSPSQSPFYVARSNQSSATGTPFLPTPPCSPKSGQFASSKRSTPESYIANTDVNNDDDVSCSSALTPREEGQSAEDLYTPFSTPLNGSTSDSCLSRTTEETSFTPSHPPSEQHDDEIPHQNTPTNQMDDVELRHFQVTNGKSATNVFSCKKRIDDALEALEVSDEDIDSTTDLDDHFSYEEEDDFSSEEADNLHSEDMTSPITSKPLQESKRYPKGDVHVDKQTRVHATTSNKKLQLINLDFVPKPPTQPPSGPVSRRHHSRASRQDTEAPRRPFLPNIKRQLGVNRIDANQSNWLETLPPSPESPQFTLPPISGVNMPRPPTQPPSKLQQP
ncbi:hypothetical protein BSL78_19154 [Apostichopus japonicus]|uniref:Uncharacterized protein n=1 Tax=Stichopus japonicus TaxID=307972 RepID=A0A2G8K7I7_STIJA|nr:hypothetical protein BSL78_19154 [Apostichopus japonicus]